MARHPHTFKDRKALRKASFFSSPAVYFPALIAALVLVALGAFLFHNVSRVSAQEILEKAVKAQSVDGPIVGIQHTRTETVSYPDITAGDTASYSYIYDSYYDYQVGRIRWVIMNGDGSKVIDVFSFDGTYTYSADQDWIANPDGDVMPVIRTIEREDALIDIVRDDANWSAEQVFQMNRNAAGVELMGEETWKDGRKVYVLRSLSRSEASASKQLADNPDAFSTQDGKGEPGQSSGSDFYTYLVFDARTYTLLATRKVIIQNGQELISSVTTSLIDELLPADSQVPWDLSDLAGIQIVDGPATTNLILASLREPNKLPEFRIREKKEVV